MRLMIEKKITPSDVGNSQLSALYRTAFPVDEQIPWQELMPLIDRMPLDFTAYMEGDALVGFTIVYPRSDFNWFWYFAVAEDLRGMGYGQKILTRLMGRYKGKTMVLDMESPLQICANSEQRRRRHQFYIRNGFRDTRLVRKYADIEMTIMISGPGEFTAADWDDITDDLKRFWWPDVD